ncbi:hypothetical protein [Pedobacter sp.]
MLQKLKRQLSLTAQAFLGQRLEPKVVVFESDDWGGIRMPSVETYRILAEKMPMIKNDRFSKFDNLASADDLSALFEVLQKHRDSRGNPAIFTFNVTTANPDFNEILHHNFERFIVEPFHQTILREQPGALSMWNDGFFAGLYRPQFHGRDHIHQQRWLTHLVNGDNVVREAFNNRTYGFESNFDGTEYLLAAYDYPSAEDHEIWKASIDHGLQIFQDFFDFVPRSFIPPCYIAPQQLVSYLQTKGVDTLQGKLYSFEPQGLSNGKRSYQKKIRKAGLNTKTGHINIVRNCFFEPSRGKGSQWVSDCLERMEVAFKWGKPAVVDTHRVNYIGSIVENNRRENLMLLDQLLTQIKRRWPDVQFMSSDQLAQLYKGK